MISEKDAPEGELTSEDAQEFKAEADVTLQASTKDELTVNDSDTPAINEHQTVRPKRSRKKTEMPAVALDMSAEMVTTTESPPYSDDLSESKISASPQRLSVRQDSILT